MQTNMYIFENLEKMHLIPSCNSVTSPERRVCSYMSPCRVEIKQLSNHQRIPCHADHDTAEKSLSLFP